MSTHLYQYKPYEYSYEYDYVFAGAGAASLSLVMRMISSGQFNNARFLVVDKDRKEKNDRTWCFWEAGEGFFEPLVYRRWNNMWFHGPGFSKRYALGRYQYKMIRGGDFYQFCLDFLKKQSNVQLLFEPVVKIESLKAGARVVLDNGEMYFAKKYVFNSIPAPLPALARGEHRLLQHFKGWIIETADKSFDTSVCTLMDFRINQEHGASFVYTMPLDDNRALVEYTLFNQNLLTDVQYETALEDYISRYLKLSNYRIAEKEYGIIPMTNQRFSEGEGQVVNIGTLGGQTKPSSGYTFQFIQQHSEDILQSMLSYGRPRLIQPTHSGRFFFYDAVLLDVLAKGELKGADVFTRMFRYNSAARIFRFLDNKSWFPEELLIMSSLPKGPFLRAAIRQLKK